MTPEAAQELQEALEAFMEAWTAEDFAAANEKGTAALARARATTTEPKEAQS